MHEGKCLQWENGVLKKFFESPLARRPVTCQAITEVAYRHKHFEKD